MYTQKHTHIHKKELTDTLNQGTKQLFIFHPKVQSPQVVSLIIYDRILKSCDLHQAALVLKHAWSFLSLVTFTFIIAG